MAKNIHTKTHEVKITCGGCSNTFQIQSSYKDTKLHIELCYSCHPAYTGKRKTVKAGRIDKFSKRFESRSTDMVSKTGTEEDK